LILKGKTLKGKNRIREQGEVWDIITTADSVLFDSRPGPWLLVVPANTSFEKARWIHAAHDHDFEIIR
jgi:hypothetical protein